MQGVLAFTSEKDEILKILVNSCIIEVDRVGVRVIKQSCAARSRDGERHAVSSFGRKVAMKIAIEDKKRENIAAECEKLTTVS